MLAPGGTLVACQDDRGAHRGARDRWGQGAVPRVGRTGGPRDAHAVPGQEEEVNEVLVETGANLSGAMVRAGLVDELVVYMAPRLMGSDARALFRLPGLERMEDAVRWALADVRAVGPDWRLTARLG